MKKLLLSTIIILLLSSVLLISCGEDVTTTTTDITTTTVTDITTTESLTYNISYELNGGTNSAENPSIYNKGDIITLSFPTREDYMFMGWYTDSALTNEIKEIKDKEENITLYAKWAPLEEIFELILVNGEYRVSRFYNNAKTVIIPSTYKGLPVVRFNTSTFFECNRMEELYISDSITSVFKRGAFQGCSSLQRIIVDEENLDFKSVDGVLYSKDGKVLISYPLAKIDKVFDVPQDVEIICEGAFVSNPYITSINIPDGVKEVYAIGFCDALESVTLPNSVTKFGGFHYCKALKSVTLSNNMEIIPYRAFINCVSLEGVTIPRSVKAIGSFAFYGCISIDEIVIPDTVTEIKNRAFENRSTELTIYCEAENKPEGWENGWNHYATVVWGYEEG